MKVIGIIPARYESSRFPGKPLADILGKSMIQRVYEQCKKANSLTEVIVATDDKRIFNHVISFGGKALMTAATHPSGTDRCNEVIQALETNMILQLIFKAMNLLLILNKLTKLFRFSAPPKQALLL